MLSEKEQGDLLQRLGFWEEEASTWQIKAHRRWWTAFWMGWIAIGEAITLYLTYSG